MKTLLDKIPVLRSVRKTFRRERKSFDTSGAYWEQRYQAGGNSGDGSYRLLADFKAEILNAFVEREQVQSVLEFGCGDGNQLKLASYPDYLGFDVSTTAVELCRQLFAGESSRTFALMDDYAGQTAELTLSLDVIYHLVEDDVFEQYMQRLFDAATRFVIVYASNTDENPDPRPPHVRHRHFVSWVERYQSQWTLREHIPNRYPYSERTQTGSFADFYVFARS